MAKGDSRIVQLIIGAKDETAKAFGNVTKGFSSLGKLAGGIAASVGAAFATVFSARTFKGAIDSAADFEQALAKIQAVTRATPAEFNALKAAAEEMGATTKFTATEAAEALDVLARTGLSAKDSITALPTVLALATAEGLELAESATAITNTISQFGLAIEDAGRVADVLVATSQKSNTNVRELGEAFKFAGTVAANFGLSVEQTAGFLGVLANAGIRAEQAGTGLRSIILSLAKDGSSLDRELDNLGITTRDLGDVIDGLAEAGVGADKALQGFEQTSQPQIRTLVAYAAAAKQLGIDLEDVEGATEAAAKTTGQTFQGAVTRLQSAWDALRRTLVEPLLEPIAREFDALAGSIGDFVSGGRLESFRQALLNAFETGAEAVRRFLTEVNPQVLLDKLGSMVTGVTSFVTSVVTSFGTIERVAQGTVAAVTAVFSGLQTFVGGVVSLITLPLRAIGTAVETAVGALRSLGLISDETANRVDNMARGLIDLNDNAITETAAAAARTGDALGDLKDAITGTVEPARKAGEEIGSIATEAEKIPTPVEAARQALEDLKAEGAGLSEIEAAQKNLNIALLEGAEKALQAEDAYTRAKDRLAELTAQGADVDELAKATERVEKAQQRFTEALTQTSDEALKVARDLREAKDAAAEQAEQIEKTKEAADALGLSYNQAANEIGGAVEKSVQQLKTLAEAGIFTSGQIREAFSKALDTAESRADVELLKETLQGLADQGAINGADLTAALQGVKDKLTEVNETAVQSIGGITAAFDGSIESVRAVLDQLDDLKKKNEEVKAAADDTAESIESVGEAADDSADSQREASGAAEGMAKVYETLTAAAKEWLAASRGITNASDSAGSALLEQAARAEHNAQALTDMAAITGGASLELQRMIDALRMSARQFRELEAAQAAASDETLSYKIRLAELRGEEEEVLRLRQKQQRAQLDLQLLQARIEGDEERVRQLQAVIKLQIAIAKEEKKQWEDREKEHKREGRALDDQEQKHGRIGSKLAGQIDQRRDIADLEEEIADKAGDTATALDRQAAASDRARSAMRDLDNTSISQLQRSIDALTDALSDGVGRGAQQARRDIQTLDTVDLRNLRGEIGQLTSALTTGISDAARAARAELDQLSKASMAALSATIDQIGARLKGLTDDITKATSDAKKAAAPVSTPAVSNLQGAIPGRLGGREGLRGDLGDLIATIIREITQAGGDAPYIQVFESREISRMAHLMATALEDGLDPIFSRGTNESSQVISVQLGGKTHKFRSLDPENALALLQAIEDQLGAKLPGTAAPAPATSPTAAEIGTAVAGALAGAPLVIQIDGEALTGAIVQQLSRAATRAN